MHCGEIECERYVYGLQRKLRRSLVDYFMAIVSQMSLGVVRRVKRCRQAGLRGQGEVVASSPRKSSAAELTVLISEESKEEEAPLP